MSTENQSELNLLCYPNRVPECHIKDSCVVVELKTNFRILVNQADTYYC